MSDKLKDIRKKYVKFLGFEYELKAFLMTVCSIVGVILLLVALDVFGVEISWYGVLFGLGFLVALFLASQLFKVRDLSPDLPYSLIWWIFPLSILGARLYYLIFNGGIQSFSQVIRFWEGGLAIYGGVIGGAIGLVICCLIKKVSIVSTTDATVPLLAIGQAFGRIGCIFGNCCYGVEVANKGLQWFPISIKVHGDYHYATNFYEAILDFVLFIVLNKLLRKCNIKGITTCSYLVGYGLIRFVLEFFRASEQTLYVGSFPVSQLVSIICVLLGVAGIVTLLLVNNRKNSSIETV